MKAVKLVEKIEWPSFDLSENFEFDALVSAGTINLLFKWINDRWNLWVTFPDGSVREAGVYPGVISWTGYTDYGFVFTSSNTDKIEYSSLLLTEAYLVTWA